MKRDYPYVDPETGKELGIIWQETDGDEIISGLLYVPYARGGDVYDVANGIPDLTFGLGESDKQAIEYYDKNADVYDEYLPLTFMTFGVDERLVRQEMVDDLRLQPNHVVLEIGAGTGRDTRLIAESLPGGKIYAQDVSLKILEKSFERLKYWDIEYSLFNASYIPFPDNFFDAVYHFGGLNTFSDIKRTFEEINRVTRVGGRVVIGDESMPVWLRETEFGKVLMNSNPLYKCELPLKYLPVSARDVRLRWIIGGVFYVFDYTVGEGEPKAVLDFEIPGVRGGTHLTRYYGGLEGITEETKELAYKAREKTGVSMSAWLNEVVQQAAERDLDDD